MSHKDLNAVHVGAPKRVAIVISNPGVSTTTGWPVGFWWAELTHPYFHFNEVGYEVEIFSPDGGPCVADAMSDPEDASQWQAEDVISRGYKHDPEFVKLVEHTKPVDELHVDDFDAIVVAGGQGPCSPSSAPRTCSTSSWSSTRPARSAPRCATARRSCATPRCRAASRS